jgi:hypothetical protein
MRWSAFCWGEQRLCRENSSMRGKSRRGEAGGAVLEPARCGSGGDVDRGVSRTGEGRLVRADCVGSCGVVRAQLRGHARRAEVARGGCRGRNGRLEHAERGSLDDAHIALAALPACFVFAGTFRLLDAKVCTTNDSARISRLIGETSDRIYVGGMRKPWDNSPVPLRVVSIPQSEVEELSIGSKPDTGPCSTQRDAR